MIRIELMVKTPAPTRSDFHLVAAVIGAAALSSAALMVWRLAEYIAYLEAAARV